MAHCRAQLTLVVNRSRRPSPAAAARAAWAEMYAGAQLMLTAKGLHCQRTAARKAKEVAHG